MASAHWQTALAFWQQVQTEAAHFLYERLENCKKFLEFLEFFRIWGDLERGLVIEERTDAVLAGG